MAISKLNPIKKKIFKRLTASFKNTPPQPGITKLKEADDIKILITRPNHRLGNQLLLTPLVQEVSNTYPKAKIHLVLNGKLSTVLFSGYPQIEKMYQLPKKPFKHLIRYIGILYQLKRDSYDIAIAANERSNSSKLFVKLARARYKIYDSGLRTEVKPCHIAKYPVYNFKSYIDPTIDLKQYVYPRLNLQLHPKELQKGKEVLQSLLGTDQKVIGLFTFATGQKCHLKKWWHCLYDKLVAHFNQHTIVEILPKERVSQIDFKAPHYYSRDIREIAAVIEQTQLFIGADSGMMHLAASTTTPVLGLFNCTQPEVYGPYGGKSEAINTAEMQIEDLLSLIKTKIEPPLLNREEWL